MQKDSASPSLASVVESLRIRFKVSGDSRSQVARVLGSLSLSLEALKVFSRWEVKRLLISHFKIIFALYFSFLNTIVLSKEMF